MWMTVLWLMTAHVSAPWLLRHEPETPEPGDLVVVYFASPHSLDESVFLQAFGMRTPMQRVSKDWLRGYVAVPLTATPGSHEVLLNRTTQTLPWRLHIKAKQFERTVSDLSVAKRFTRKPARSIRRRIAREQRAFDRAVHARPSDPKNYGRWLKPVLGSVTSPFGAQRVFNARRVSTHYGLDLDGVPGDPIQAAAEGVVLLSAEHWVSGQLVVIDHGGGLSSAYFHLSERFVIPGQHVFAGQRIGSVGSSGRVTGPHLHFAVMLRVDDLAKETPVARHLFVDPARTLVLRFEGHPAYCGLSLDTLSHRLPLARALLAQDTRVLPKSLNFCAVSPQLLSDRL